MMMIMAVVSDYDGDDDDDKEDNLYDGMIIYV